MGMAGTRFGRNVPLRFTEPEQGARLMTPNPRLVSTALLARGEEMIPATTLNVIAAAWLQFQTRDWFSHGTDVERPFAVPRPPGDTWPADPILLPRTARDPHAVGDPAGPDLPGRSSTPRPTGGTPRRSTAPLPSSSARSAVRNWGRARSRSVRTA